MHYDHQMRIAREHARAAAQRPQRSRATPAAAAALVATLALAGLAACEGGDGTTGEDRPAIPKLAGESTAAARKALDRKGLKVSVDEQWSERAPAGGVLSSQPQPGARRRRGATVKLTVSKGPPPGPHGALAAASVGPLKIGGPAGEVVDEFGAPDAKRPVSYVAGAVRLEDWTWADPEFTLQIDRNYDAVSGYCTTSPTFKTRPLGLSPGRVRGSGVAKAAARAGRPATLAPAHDPRSEGSLRNRLISAGKPGSYPALVFNADEADAVYEVCGGYPPPVVK